MSKRCKMHNKKLYNQFTRLVAYIIKRKSFSFDFLQMQLEELTSLNNLLNNNSYKNL